MKNTDKAANCFDKSAESYFALDSIFMAGKAYENAALVIKESPLDAIKYYRKASDCYQVKLLNNSYVVVAIGRQNYLTKLLS